MLDSPFVGSIFIEPEFRRKNIATLLYKKSFSIMEYKGFVFRSSTLQSESAKLVWDSLEKEGLVTKNGDYYIFK